MRPVSAPVTAPGTACLEAHDLLVARERLYGPMASSWDRVAELVDLIAAPSDSPGQRATLTLLAMKLVRRRHSPENPDHIRDACGYLGILDRQRRDRDARDLSRRVDAAFDGDWKAEAQVAGYFRRERIVSEGREGGES